MKRACLPIVVMVASGPAASQADPLAPWSIFIEEAAQRFALPREWIERVMLAESGGQTRRNGTPIRSSAGAIGLMQLMPDTYADMRRRLNLGDDPDVPHDNILAGAGYLRLMYDRFGYPALFAGYNAGPERYAESFQGRPLPAETRQYLGKVTAKLSLSPTTSALFATLNSSENGSEIQSATGLFVTLNHPDNPEN